MTMRGFRLWCAKNVDSENDVIASENQIWQRTSVRPSVRPSDCNIQSLLLRLLFAARYS